MLILSRKTDESIILGDNIEVKVISVEGNRVKLGIQAPDDVDIYRHELYEQIKEENKEAAKASLRGLLGLNKIFK